MKNRYFGDLYDYIKYALLRQFTDSDTSTAVCWMLTEDDGGNDGHRTNHLREPKIWSSFDPPLFNFLRDQVLELSIRNITAIEKSNILPQCRFYSTNLSDDGFQRQHYFDQFLEFARGAALVFFDPDNGVAVKSVKYGRRNSSKYLYWNEIKQTFRAGHSVLIYQHLPPQPRDRFIRRIARKILEASGGSVVFAIRTKKVAFFLVPRRGSLSQFRKSVSIIEKRWDGILRVSELR